MRGERRSANGNVEPYGEEITVICVGPVGGPEMTLPQGSSEQERGKQMNSPLRQSVKVIVLKVDKQETNI